MTNILGNTILGAGGLTAANLLSGGKVMDAIDWTIDSVGDVLAGETVLSHLPSVVSDIALPGATALFSGYKGIKEASNSGIYQGLQKGALNYGLIGTLGGAIGLINAPMSVGVLATGVGMWGAKKIHNAAMDSITKIKGINPGEMLVNGIKKIGNSKILGGTGN